MSTYSDLNGHSMGNLILTAFYQETGSLKKSIENFSKLIYENIKQGKYEVLEDDLLTTNDGTIRHDSLKLSSIIFSYLMR